MTSTAATSKTEVTAYCGGYYSSGYSRTSDIYISFNSCVCCITRFRFISCFSFINYVFFIGYLSFISFINCISFIVFNNYITFISFIIGFRGWLLRPVS